MWLYKENKGRIEISKDFSYYFGVFHNPWELFFQNNI